LYATAACFEQSLAGSNEQDSNNQQIEQSQALEDLENPKYQVEKPMSSRCM
jgi:hypothetical protein